MSGSVNKVILIGALGGDPEVKLLEGGKSIARFSLATTESYTDKSGVKQQLTEWHRIEAWDKLAQIAEKYLKKGSSVYVEGKIKTESWVDKDGNKRSAISIRINSLTMLGGGQQKPESDNPVPAFNPQESDDDLPF